MNGVELTGTGLLLGLANGPACLLTCTPAVLPAFISTTAAGARKQFAWPILGRLMGGRLLAYLLVGLLSGGTLSHRAFNRILALSPLSYGPYPGLGTGCWSWSSSDFFSGLFFGGLRFICSRWDLGAIWHRARCLYAWPGALP